MKLSHSVRHTVVAQLDKTPPGFGSWSLSLAPLRLSTRKLSTNNSRLEPISVIAVINSC